MLSLLTSTMFCFASLASSHLLRGCGLRSIAITAACSIVPVHCLINSEMECQFFFFWLLVLCHSYSLKFGAKYSPAGAKGRINCYFWHQHVHHD